MAEKNIVQTESNTGQLTNIATTDVAGIASFNTDDFAVDENGKVSSKQKVGAIQYIGMSVKLSEIGNYLYWDLDALTSPKKIKDIKLGDLILYCGEEYNVTDNIVLYPGDIFVIESATSEGIATSTIRFSSIRGHVGETGEKGAKGDTGAQGIQGPGGEVEIGTVETLDTGEAAYVIKDTDKSTAGTSVFNFGLPRGETGANGKDATGYVAMEVIDGCLYCITNIGSDIEDFSLDGGNLVMEVG